MRALVVAAVSLALAACGGGGGPSPDDVAAESAALTEYLDAEFEEELQRSPEWLTRLGRKERYDELSDVSEAEMDADIAWRRDSVKTMKARFDYDKLDDAAKTSFDIWALELERADDGRPWRRHQYIFARGGPHTGLPNFMINFHKVDTVADMEAYISRVSEIGRVIDQYLVRAKAATDDGVRMPRFAYEQTLSEARRVMAGAPFTDGGWSPMYEDVVAKTNALLESGQTNDLGAAELLERASVAMNEDMKPAYDRLIAWLEEDIVNTTEDARGAFSLPDGEAYYDWRLKNQTTTDMTADEIHELGLQEVARIQAEMEQIKQTVGFDGSLQDFFHYMRTDGQFFLPNTDEGREEYLAQARGHLDKVKMKLPEYFGMLPKADLEVRRVEAFREEPGGAAHYMSGAPDGSRPGAFYVHLSDMSAVSTFRLENLCYHEGLPGHHMQRSIAQEMDGLPVFRGQYSYTAYTEGWALYAEYLGKDMGGYEDPYSDFGRLSGEIWRAVRLVVDTGLHAKGWSEQQGVEYALANSPRPESSVRSEMRRYLVNPAQATTYKIGMNHILELRAEAQAELGSAFSYAGFHDVVLGGGAVPLPILTKRVRAWVEGVKGAAL